MNVSSKTIDALREEWESYLPLAADRDRRLWRKLRMEWNYHSNHIEGNTLTYGETELYLIHGQTHGSHTWREYEEMKAHDVGISHLRELAEDRSRMIGEGDIRNLNKIILKEPFWKPARTEEGEASRKQIIPGEYKTTPNNVITATGEWFEFAAPCDVSVKMRALVEWLESALSSDVSILPVLAKLHHGFVLIHPFDDGNGRVARMLVNYVLMRQGFPPIIVPTERKADYLAALRLADAGDLSELEGFLGGCVMRSLELGLRAARGESLAEPGDVEKEAALFVKSRVILPVPAVVRSTDVVVNLHAEGFRYLLKRLEDKIQIFKPLFARLSLSTEPRGMKDEGSVLDVLDFCLEKGVEDYPWMMWVFKFDGYLVEGGDSFGTQVMVELQMDELEYLWKIAGGPKLRKSYSEPVTSEEANLFVEAVLKCVLDDIRKRSSDGG